MCFLNNELDYGVCILSKDFGPSTFIPLFVGLFSLLPKSYACDCTLNRDSKEIKTG
jgi:hypothetical protein